MGIPGFYRWLAAKNRAAVADVREDYPESINGVKAPVDTTKPNPNGVEFDNLYLDMNGIIHPCFHPDESAYSPKSFDEVFTRVFNYIDRIFSLIRPRKLLFVAIDGVAPRAKMNQQRARRFKASKEASDARMRYVRTAKKTYVYTPKEKGIQSVSEGLDSNVITPGTEFMELLSSALQYYIHRRMNEDPGWEGLKVILSDASVPGEGEQKIMSYIRLQRNLPGYDPNTRHCLYGMDADLIMLALATHEVHFSVLREAQAHVRKGSKKKKTAKRGNAKRRRFLMRFDDFVSRQKFQFLHMWILRECLAKMLEIPDPLAEVDLERLIDDFVFMCLFVGNDFLPHVPSLEVSEGAIDLLISVYKEEFVRMGGYLTDSSEVNLERLEHFVQTLGSHEDAIFKKWRQLHCGKKRRMIAMSPRFVEDKVNLGEDGWKKRYYNEKFKIKSDGDHEAVKKHCVLKYVEGICWVMHYYYQGVCSWQWFYPYHYAPFASDFRGLDQLKIDFVLGEPFKPINQLMGVLPAASAHALPLHYSYLMKNSSSPILDFYPTEFERDLNGKKQPWKAICRLPFIDEGRLLAAIAKVERTLTDAERQRNTFGLDKLFIHMSHALATQIVTFFERNKDLPRVHIAKVEEKINPKLSGGMNGYICISEKPICPAEVPSPVCYMKTIMNNKVVFVFYKYPEFHPHITRPPEGVVMHEKPVGWPRWTRPKLCDVETAIGQTELTTRCPPCMTVEGPNLAKKKSKKKRKLEAKLKRASLSGNGEVQGEVGKTRFDFLNTDNTTKMNTTYLVGKSEEKEVGKTSHDALNQNTTIKLDKSCLVNKSEEQGEAGKITNNEVNDSSKKKRKRDNKKRKLDSSCLIVNGENQVEVGKLTSDALNDNKTTKLDSMLLVSKSEDQVVGKIEHDALNDNTKVERNRIKRMRKKLNRKLKSASLPGNAEVQGEFGKARLDSLNTDNTAKVDNTYLVGKSEDIGEVVKTIHEAPNQNTTIKLDNSCLVNKSEDQGEAGKITNDAVNDNSQKKKKRGNKKRKLDSACLVANGEDQVKVTDGEDQVEVGKTTHDAPKEISTLKLDNSCSVNISEEQGEAGKITNDPINDNSKKKKKRGNKKRKLDSACLVANGEDQVKVTDGEDQVEVGKTTHDAPKEISTLKLDNSCSVNISEEQGEAGKIANDAVNDNSQKKKKRGNKKRILDSAFLVANGEDQVKVTDGEDPVEVGKTTHDAPKENSTLKLDNSCLVNKSEEQGEAGKITNDPINDNSKKKKKRGNKKRNLDSACLVANGGDQVEVGKTTHDALNQNTTIKLDNSCLVNKSEEQGEAGKITNDAVNDNSKKKNKKKRENKKRKLDSACLVANGQDQVKVTNGQDQVEVGRMTRDDTTREGFGELWNLLQAAMSRTRGLQTEM